MTKELFRKFLEGSCSEKEFEEILLWIKEGSVSPEGNEIVHEVWAEFEPQARPAERMRYNRLLQNIHHRIEVAEEANEPVIRRLPYRKTVLTVITRVAAILLLPVLSLLIYTLSSDKYRYDENISDLEVQAPAGFRMNIRLGDGTQVWLNHNSKLRYPYKFTGKNRRVYLTGEAYFKVAHNSRIPFIVATDKMNVKATGTAFNVSAYPGDDFVETTLVEGKVILYDNVRNKEIKVLSPSECLMFNPRKNSYKLESGDIQEYISWKDGILVFKNDSISEIARKLQQWYNVDVRITDERVKEFTCTGTFYDETLSQVLELMSLPSPVSYRLTPIKKLADGSYSKQSVVIGLKKH